MKVVIVDLDSTLGHTQHRQHLINREDWHATDWIAYALASTDDELFEGTAALIRLLHDLGVCVWLLSGRSGPPEVQAVTEEWLARHKVAYDILTLRPPEDESKNGDFKRREIERFQECFPDAEIVLMIDDWPPVSSALADVCPVLLVNPNYGDNGDARDDSALIGGAALL